MTSSRWTYPDYEPPAKDDLPESIESLTFWVPGVAIPQGSKSIFRGRLVEANKKLRPWRAVVKAAAVEALAGREGFTDAVYVSMDFYLPRGKTVVRRRPSVKPDADKLARAINDSLTDSGVLKDDGLIVDLHPRKWYADDEPGVRIKVSAA